MGRNQCMRCRRRRRLRSAAAAANRLPPPCCSCSLSAPPAVYLVQGLLGLSRLAVFTFLKDDLALAPATVALITSAGYAPWVRATAAQGAATPRL